MDNSFALNFITKLGEDVEDSQGKSVRIYLSYYKNDLEEARKLARRLLNKIDAIIYFRRYDLYPEVDENTLTSSIDQLQVTLILVTSNYLNAVDNDAYNTEFEYIKKNNIPYLPIMDAGDLLKLYEDKFGTVQYFELNQNDNTKISFDKKIKDYLRTYVVHDGDYLLAKEAFKNHLFLSYRKKDRLLAISLINAIHNDERCQDVAIWYDEFLVAGEEFPQKIEDKLNTSDAFLLLVTPNLINEDNYVKEIEYKKAREIGKKIVPVNARETNRYELARQFEGIPDLIESKDIVSYLLKIINSGDEEYPPKKLFALGIAYLFGIEVEINRKIALKYLMEAADKGYLKAVKFLVDIYEDGNGVVKDFDKANEYRERLIKEYGKNANFDVFDDMGLDYFSEKLQYARLKNMPNPRMFVKSFHEIYRQLSSFKTINEDLEAAYYYLKLNIFDEAMNIVISAKIENPFSYADYRRDLEKLEEADYSLYIVQNVMYVALYYLYGGADYEEREEHISDYKDSIADIAEIDFEQACLCIFTSRSLIENSKYLSIEEKTDLFLFHLQYLERSEKLTGEAIKTKLSLIDLNLNNPLIDVENLKNEVLKAARTYKKQHYADNVIASIYYTLFLSEENKAKMIGYAEKVLEEFSNYSDEQLKELGLIDPYITCSSALIMANKELSDEERISEFEKLFEKVASNPNGGLGKNYILISLLSYYSEHKNVEKYDYYFRHIDEIYGTDADRVFVYYFLECYLHKSLEKIDHYFDFYREKLAMDHPTDPSYQMSVTLEQICDCCHKLNPHDIEDEPYGKKLFDLFKKVAKDDEEIYQSYSILRNYYDFYRYYPFYVDDGNGMSSAFDEGVAFFEKYMEGREYGEQSLDETLNAFNHYATYFLSFAYAKKELFEKMLSNCYRCSLLAIDKMPIEQVKSADLSMFYLYSFLSSDSGKEPFKNDCLKYYDSFSLCLIGLNTIDYLSAAKKIDKGAVIDLTAEACLAIKDIGFSGNIKDFASSVYSSLSQLAVRKQYELADRFLGKIISSLDEEQGFSVFLFILKGFRYMNAFLGGKDEIIKTRFEELNAISQVKIGSYSQRFFGPYYANALDYYKNNFKKDELRIFDKILIDHFVVAGMINNAEGSYHFTQVFLENAIESIERGVAFKAGLPIAPGITLTFQKIKEAYKESELAWIHYVLARYYKLVIDYFYESKNYRNVLVKFFELTSFNHNNDGTLNISKAYPLLLTKVIESDWALFHNLDNCLAYTRMAINNLVNFCQYNGFECYDHLFETALSIIPENKPRRKELMMLRLLTMESDLPLTQICDEYIGYVEQQETIDEKCLYETLVKYIDLKYKNELRSVEVRKILHEIYMRLSKYSEEKNDDEEAFKYQSLAKSFGQAD